MDDNDIVRQVNNGNKNIFKILVKKYQKPLHRFIYPKVFGADVADDLTQETLFRAYRKLDTYNPKGMSFKNWLYLQARSVVSNNIKKKTGYGNLLKDVKNRSNMEPDHGNDTGLNEERDIRRICVDEKLKLLPDEERELVILFFKNGMTKKEIAEIWKCHPKTISRHLDRLMEKIVPLMGECL